MGDFNTTLSQIDRSFRQKLNRNAGAIRCYKPTDLVDTYRTFYPNLVDTYRTFYPHTRVYTVCSAWHRTFSNIDHIFRNKASLNRYKKINITLCILSDHHRLKLAFNSIRNNINFIDSWKLINSVLEEKWVKTEIKKIKSLEFNETEYTGYPNLLDTLKVVLKGKHIALVPTLKNQNKQEKAKKERI